MNGSRGIFRCSSNLGVPRPSNAYSAARIDHQIGAVRARQMVDLKSFPLSIQHGELMRVFSLAIAAYGSLVAQSAAASVIWNWSFASEEGTFVTSGEGVSGSLAPGSYKLTNFSVTKGKYLAVGDMIRRCDYCVVYDTLPGKQDQPYFIDWSGDAITQIRNSSPPSANGSFPNTWIFGRYEASRTWVSFTLGNNRSEASLFTIGGLDQDYGDAADAPLRVSLASIAAVPEPATWLTMLTGFAVTGFSMRRRKSGQRAVI